MIELVRTNDPVMISWLTCHLEAAGVEFMVFDTHTSILEGSIGAIPQRVMILEEQDAEARMVLSRLPSGVAECRPEEPSPEAGGGVPDLSADPVMS